ncbi:MAG TPA: HAD family phosphatase [Dyella sp.]|uniref:HAD family hydrolase n=1 Tax=Dyella sp. TaxID=1869338 RepID=UPI002D7942E9|nr:HAD family phosphatase [Dyella sp.]HET6555121.1 HAD family phosphatase [Dyella sp.]
MLRCILFDLDEVLADYDRAVRVGHLADAIGSTPEQVRAAIHASGIEDAADRGALTPEAYLDALSAFLGRKVSADAWTAARRTATHVRPDVRDLVARIGARMDVALLTNNGVLMARQLRRIAPSLFPLFEGRAFASAEFGAIKPDSRVYLACLDRPGVPADATLFVDDNEAHVQGALRAGLHGHHYRDLAGLSAALATFGLP